MKGYLLKDILVLSKVQSSSFASVKWLCYNRKYPGAYTEARGCDQGGGAAQINL